MDLIILKRKGFARMSLITGAPLVPVIGFGENELYRIIKSKWLYPFERITKKILKMPIPIFWGRTPFVPLFPRRIPLITVGKFIGFYEINHVYYVSFVIILSIIN